MQMKRAGRFVLYAMTVATLGGCTMGLAGRGGTEVVGISFMLTEPPAERVEVISEAPGREYVWVRGHYIRIGNEYAWREGHWERPAGTYRSWVPGRWEHERRGWFYVEGHWAS